MRLKNLLVEKNVPTNPSKWDKWVGKAKEKFDVYPSAYANAWAAKMYKDDGGGWKNEGVEKVAVALPQTKELKGKKIGERFLEYLQDNGLKHAAYETQDGDVKIVGLNKDQVKEVLGKLVNEWNAKTKESVNEEVGLNFQWIYKKVNKNKKAFFDFLSNERKKFGDDYYSGLLHYTLKDYKENPSKYKTIKDKEEKLWQMAVAGKKFNDSDSVNEAASKEAMGIASFTGTRADAVQKFIDTHKINGDKLFNFIKKGKLSDRTDFVKALAGNPI